MSDVNQLSFSLLYFVFMRFNFDGIIMTLKLLLYEFRKSVCKKRFMSCRHDIVDRMKESLLSMLIFADNKNIIIKIL